MSLSEPLAFRAHRRAVGGGWPSTTSSAAPRRPSTSRLVTAAWVSAIVLPRRDGAPRTSSAGPSAAASNPVAGREADGRAERRKQNQRDGAGEQRAEEGTTIRTKTPSMVSTSSIKFVSSSPLR